MSNIINTDDNSRHVIKQFSFQKLDVNDEDIIDHPQNPFEDPSPNEEDLAQENKTVQKKSDIAIPDHQELLQKIEQLTSDIVGLQMQQEKDEQDFISQLQKEKNEAYEAGKADGMKEFQEHSANEIEDLKTQLIRSITLLDEQKQKFEQTLETLEEELLQSTFVLAKKVIIKEVDENSNQIAVYIAKSLMQTLHESSGVTLKVNPIDKSYISSHFKDNHIRIEEDDAIQKGGIVILSDSGNIDGNILTRYKQSLLLLEKES